jgi:hypothetical protein
MIMSVTLFKEVSYSLNKLIQDIDMGEIGLPDIQRPFVWPNKKVRDLFDSMYKGFPVGYLLFWANGAGEDHRQIGTTNKQKVARLLIVDGQQRLTSLYAVLKGQEVIRSDYSKEKIQIAFNPLEEKFEVADAAIKRSPEWISDISELWSGNVKRHRFVKDFLDNLKSKNEISEEQYDYLFEVIDQLYDLQSYPFIALELSRSVNEEDVADVFVRINSKGTILNQADFILTLMSVFWDEGRMELEQFCRNLRVPNTSRSSPFNYFIQPDPDQLLRVSVALAFRRARLQYVYNILRGKDLETGKFSDKRRNEQFEVLQYAQNQVLNIQNWHEFLKILLSAGYRKGEMISSKIGLIYSYAIYLIGKQDYGIESFQLRNVIAKWYFMTALTARYSASPETKMEQDLNNLRDLNTTTEFIEYLNSTVEDTLTDDFWNITLPNNLATTSARGPSLFAYYASLNLLDAQGLFSNIKVSELLEAGIRAKKSALERHHLFPKAHLERIGISEQRDQNQIVNYALVEWSTNIAISDASPDEYFKQYCNLFTSDKIKEMMHYHALPNGWGKMEYFEFLVTRRRLIAGVIREGYEKLQEKKL